MLKQFFFCLCVFLATGECYEEDIDPELDTRIIGADDVHPKTVMHQAIVRVNRWYRCSGSIIALRTILTNAHCINKLDPKKITITVGTIFLNHGGDVYNVSGIKVHENYSRKTKFNDIGLIFLDHEINLKSNIKVILPGGMMIRVGTPVVLYGWGKPRTWGRYSEKLQELELTTISNPLCTFWLNWYIGDGQICTRNYYGEGLCYGDDGDGLVHRGVLVGIASFAYPCGVGFPDVYTRVSFYMSWIYSNIIY